MSDEWVILFRHLFKLHDQFMSLERVIELMVRIHHRNLPTILSTLLASSAKTRVSWIMQITSNHHLKQQFFIDVLEILKKWPGDDYDKVYALLSFYFDSPESWDACLFLLKHKQLNHINIAILVRYPALCDLIQLNAEITNELFYNPAFALFTGKLFSTQRITWYQIRPFIQGCAMHWNDSVSEETLVPAIMHAVNLGYMQAAVYAEMIQNPVFCRMLHFASTLHELKLAFELSQKLQSLQSEIASYNKKNPDRAIRLSEDITALMLGSKESDSLSFKLLFIRMRAMIRNVDILQDHKILSDLESFISSRIQQLHQPIGLNPYSFLSNQLDCSTPLFPTYPCCLTNKMT